MGRKRNWSGWQGRENDMEWNLRLAVGVGRVVQTDTTGNAGVAGVHTSIKYNLMLKGLLMCYGSDP